MTKTRILESVSMLQRFQVISTHDKIGHSNFGPYDFKTVIETMYHKKILGMDMRIILRKYVKKIYFHFIFAFIDCD